MRSDYFAEAVREHFAPLLKAAGFAKRNLTWNRVDGELVDVVNIQKSRHSDAELSLIEFRVNLSIGFAPASARTVARHFDAPNCMRRTLTYLAHEFQTDFWMITPVLPETVTPVIRHATVLMRDFGLPWFDAQKMPKTLRRLVEERELKNWCLDKAGRTDLRGALCRRLNSIEERECSDAT